MLFGKISPQAIVPQMITPFQQTDIVAEYIAAIATPYRLGANAVDFQVMYGNPIYNEDGVVKAFDAVHQVMVNLSGAEIDDWGTDDRTMLTTIAVKQGTSITKFENWDV